MPPCVGGFSKARPEQGLIILALFLTAMLLPMSHFEKEQRFLASFFSFSFFLVHPVSQGAGGVQRSMLKWMQRMQSCMSGAPSSSFKDLLWRMLSCGLLCFPPHSDMLYKTTSIPAIIIQLFMA